MCSNLYMMRSRNIKGPMSRAHGPKIGPNLLTGAMSNANIKFVQYALQGEPHLSVVKRERCQAMRLPLVLVASPPITTANFHTIASNSAYAAVS